MSSRKPYKHAKRGGSRFVQLPEWLQATEAWATMPPGPRALYIELKRRYNGANNGDILFSHRQAAEALNAHRNTVGGWFDVLINRGFIELAVAPCLGPSGIGKASMWAIDEVPRSDGRPARKRFTSWRATGGEKLELQERYARAREKTKSPAQISSRTSQKTGQSNLTKPDI